MALIASYGKIKGFFNSVSSSSGGNGFLLWSWLVINQKKPLHIGRGLAGSWSRLPLVRPLLWSGLPLGAGQPSGIKKPLHIGRGLAGAGVMIGQK